MTALGLFSVSLALVSLPVHADLADRFQQACKENDAIIASVQPQGVPVQAAAGVCGHRGQLNREDVSQIESVQPAATAPKELTIIHGLYAHRGQLSAEDISQIESVQPANAVWYGHASN